MVIYIYICPSAINSWNIHINAIRYYINSYNIRVYIDGHYAHNVHAYIPPDINSHNVCVYT